MEGQETVDYQLGTVIPSVIDGAIDVTLNTADINLIIEGGDVLDDQKFYIELYETVSGTDSLISTRNIMKARLRQVRKRIW